MTKLSNIVFEQGRTWVHKDKDGLFTVYVNGITHATSDSTYATLDLARARAQWLDNRKVTLHPSCVPAPAAASCQ